MSLRDLAAEINAQSGTSNVSAQVIQTSESGFQLVISGTETAQDLTTTSTGGDDVLNLLGVTDGVGGFLNELQAASQARINFDGVEVTRNDNVLDDVVDGIEFNLNNAAPGTIISLEVGNDAGAARAAIEEFINAYNTFRDFVAQNRQVSADGVVAEDAILFGDNLMDLIANTYSNYIGGQFNDTNDIRTIRDLGIRIGNGNKLEISDPARLDTALLNNFDAVRDAFAGRADSDNDEFRLSRNEGVTPTQAIVFDITTDGAGTITGVTANGDGSAFTIDGNRIVGAEGTQYEGLRFTYIGTDANVTINVDFNQGLSERLLNSIEPFNSINNGLLVQERASLQSINNEKAQEAAEIRTRAEEFRASEIDRYAKLEADITALNLLLDQIRAILGADRDDD
jgi:flagellar hook-associated protein 2